MVLLPSRTGSLVVRHRPIVPLPPGTAGEGPNLILGGTGNATPERCGCNSEMLGWLEAVHVGNGRRPRTGRAGPGDIPPVSVHSLVTFA